MIVTPVQETQTIERALHIVAQHLIQALRSHEKTLSLQAQGQCQEARQQSRMTRVFLHNALCRIDQHAPQEDPY